MSVNKQELEEKKQRNNLLKLCNSIASAFSFKQVKTWRDVYVKAGQSDEYIAATYKPDELAKLVTYKELKDYFAKLQGELEVVIAARRAPKPETPPEMEKIQPITPLVEETLNADNYGLPLFPKLKAYLFWFQKKAVKALLDGILGVDIAQFASVDELKSWYQKTGRLVKQTKRSQCLLASTGTGKTFMAAAVVAYLKYIGFEQDKTFGPVEYLYVTRATIVEQTKRVFETLFCLSPKDGIEILNIEQLRARAGQLWIEERIVIVNGKEQTEWKWKPRIHPVVVLWDESQALKNDGSTQHQIGAAFNEIPTNTWQVHISATPFTRVCEARCFAVGTRKIISDRVGTLQETRLSNGTWPTYSGAIASPASPTDYNEAAVERLTKDLSDYIVRVKGVRSQFEATNRIELISFKTKEEKEYYDDTEARYYREKAKLDAKLAEGSAVNGTMLHLVLLMKRCMAAEKCRARQIAERCKALVDGGQYAAAAALKYKPTIIDIVKILVDEMGVSRDDISLVWGGGQTALTAKQKAKAQIKLKEEQLLAAGFTKEEIMETLGLEDVEDRALEDLPEHLRLGPQSKEERQKEIDRYQSGRTKYCFFTFKAGGVGLSLHHTDELTKVKCRRKPNGYAYVEDIPLIPVRPRKVIVAPTYSAIELVQGLGRCPRLTSLSPTEQVLLFYRGTVEEDVADIVSQKLRCLSRVVRMREKWEDVIVGGHKQDHLEPEDKIRPDDPDELVAEVDEEDEE